MSGRNLNVACTDARKKLILLLLRKVVSHLIEVTLFALSSIKGDPEKILKQFPILAKDRHAEMRLKVEDDTSSIYEKLLEPETMKSISSYEKFLKENEKKLEQDFNLVLKKIFFLNKQTATLE